MAGVVFNFSHETLRILFGIFMVGVGLSMLRPKKEPAAVDGGASGGTG